MSWRSHFALSKSQQNGIFVLVLLIIIFQVILFTTNYFSWDDENDISENPEIEKYQRQLDSVKAAEQTFRKDTIFPFNPNFLTDFKGYQLGMSPEEIYRILNYRKEGKWINSEGDFQKISKIPDSLFLKIRPLLRFPKWTEGVVSKQVKTQYNAPRNILIVDLNAATAEDLKQISGIGEVLSERIVKYRYKIGGFRSAIQLQDVYGLKPEVIAQINTRFEVLSRPDPAVRSINTIQLEELAQIPYFDYEMAREIINYRKLHERIESFAELSKIKGFPSDKIDRIKLYLAID